MTVFKTRFAPSPTGPLHLGHAYSALLAYDMAMAEGGEFLLRIEDIDRERSKSHWEDQIFDDLSWLGICWSKPALRQQARQAAYDAALDQLWDMGLLYPCTCTRRDIQEALSAPQEGSPILGPDGVVYPGTCRPSLESWQRPVGSRPIGVALRLDMRRATDHLGENLSGAGSFQETGAGPDGESGLVSFAANGLIEGVGDVVLSRKGFGTSYHLSVVIDDAFQGITHVVRGQDLFSATPIHVLLQGLLNLPTPTYHHHALIRDDTGKRLAKRDDARAIATYRSKGKTVADIRKMVGL